MPPLFCTAWRVKSLCGKLGLIFYEFCISIDEGALAPYRGRESAKAWLCERTALTPFLQMTVLLSRPLPLAPCRTGG